MVQLESDGWVGVRNDLKRLHVVQYYIGEDVGSFPPILCMAMMAVWSESKLINPYPELIYPCKSSDRTLRTTHLRALQ